MHRRVGCALAILVLSLPSDARAVDFTDARDAFSFALEVPGMPACVTYPLDRVDRVECDGLDPAREADLRASTPAGTEWIGASVFRGDTWGFRLSITRIDLAPGFMGEREDRALLSTCRDLVRRSLVHGQLVGGEAGLAAELRTLNEVRIARFAYSFKTDSVGVLRTIKYAVPSEHGLYEVTLLADVAHAEELEKIGDRALASLRVHPRPRTQTLVVMLAFYVGLPVCALFGVVLLIARLASTRKGAGATVSWPGVRDRGES